MAELDRRQSMTPMQALHALRILWAVLLVSPLVIGGVLVALMDADPPQDDPSLRQVLSIVGMTLPIAMVFGGLFARNQVYKAHWRGNVITPGGYVTGNITLFASLEAVYILAFVLMFVIGFHLGLIAIATAAILIHLANFPTGKPMQPHEPSLPSPEHL